MSSLRPHGTEARTVRAVSPRRGRLHAALATARPRQWLKNALVIAAPAAAGALTHDDVPVRVGLACAAFCMLASGIYAINDVRDAEEDRHHPTKRFRPVAAGELSPQVALAAGIGSIVAGVLLCAAIRPLLALVAVAYIALTVTYTLVWRHVVVLDVVTLSGGFVLRAVAGGVAAPVTLSRWFLLVITFAAILVAAGKRHAELARHAEGPPRPHRRVLSSYSHTGLGAILWVAALGAIFAYVMWAFAVPAVHGVPWRPLTLIPFVGAIASYLRLVRTGEGETPEDLFLRDRWLLAMGVGWVVLFVLDIHVTG